MRSVFLPALLFCLSLSAQTHRTIGDFTPADPEIEALLAPYREQLSAELGVTLLETREPLAKQQPASRLSNVVADSLLWKARQAVGEHVDLAVTNFGGIRTSLGAGPITVGEVYEVSPFDNALVVLPMTGAEVLELAAQIAALGGEPVSGMTLVIREDETAADVRIGGEPVDPDGRYHVATIDYLSGGNGGMPALWDHSDTETTSVFQRDALIAYLHHLGAEGVVLDASFEPRIRLEP